MSQASKPVIRAYTPQDAAALAAIFRDAILSVDEALYSTAQKAAWLGDNSLDFWVQRFSKTQPFVASIDGQTAGFLELIIDGGLIDCCYVAPEYQQKGIGRSLVRHAINCAKARGLNHLSVHVSDAALPLFSHLGFRAVRRESQQRRGVTLSNTLMHYSITDD